MNATGQEIEETPADGPIIARAGREYRFKRYAMVLLFVSFGGWFAYDGWVRYPRQNEEARARGEEKMPHSGESEPIISGAMHGADIPLQRFLAFATPVLGLAILIRTLHRSRGEYRLEDGTLHIPGHPPVPMQNIRRLDDSLWRKKEITEVDYVTDDGVEQRLTLDAFVYDQEPTYSIHDQIAALPQLVPSDPEVAAD